jgi:hypothetical protein
VVGLVSLTACGGGEERVSLAIDAAEHVDGAVLLRTACATDIEVEARPDPAGSGLVQVSLWGRPEIGRCRPTVEVEGIGGDATALVDAATAQVVDIAPR